EQPLDPSRLYLLKQTTQLLPAEIKAVRHHVNIGTLEHEPAAQLEMNGIGVLRIETSRPIYFDGYTQNRSTGSFILIDSETNATVAAGMILTPVVAERNRPQSAIELKHDRVTPVERIARYRHGGETVSLGARTALAWLVERRLFDRGCNVAILDRASEETLEALEHAGVLVLLVSGGEPDWELPENDEEAADFVIATLEESGALLPKESLTGGEGI